MFSLFKKDPKKELEAKYAKLMEEAMKRQQNGDIEAYSKLSFEAEQVLKQIDCLDRDS